MKFGFGSVPFLAAVTPPAPPAGPSWVAVGVGDNIFSPSAIHDFPVPVGAAVGDMVILLLNNWDVPTSVETSTGQTLVALGRYTSAGELCQAFGVVLAGSVPTDITAEFGSSVQIAYQVAVARGVTAAGGLVNNGVQFSALSTIPYTANVTNSLVMSLVQNQPTTTTMTSATINGSDPVTITAGWEAGMVLMTGVHNGTSGAKTMGASFSAGTTSGRWFSLELVP